jgi:hypothetical protein
MKLVRTLVAGLMMLEVTPDASQAAAAVHAIMHGNELLRVCNSVLDIPDEFDGCDTYIVGATDALDLVAPHLTNICRPQSHAIQQLRDIVVNWLGEHPEERHRPAAKLIGLALAEAWPCDR